jgi:hypothetical protein
VPGGPEFGERLNEINAEDKGNTYINVVSNKNKIMIVTASNFFI